MEDTLGTFRTCRVSRVHSHQGGALSEGRTVASIPFAVADNAQVCEVVRQYAFHRTTLPLIVSLEVHCSPPQQEIVCELMQDYWGEFLVKVPDGLSDSTPLPSLESLRKKILVKVKFVPPEKAKNKDAHEDDSSEDEGDTVKKSKVIEKLSSMGVFTRAFHFQSFDHPTSSIPTHVFSFGESKLLKACEEQPDQLMKHNLHYLMRAYPKGDIPRQRTR